MYFTILFKYTNYFSKDLHKILNGKIQVREKNPSSPFASIPVIFDKLGFNFKQIEFAFIITTFISNWFGLLITIVSNYL